MLIIDLLLAGLIVVGFMKSNMVTSRTHEVLLIALGGYAIAMCFDYMGLAVTGVTFLSLAGLNTIVGMYVKYRRSEDSAYLVSKVR